MTRVAAFLLAFLLASCIAVPRAVEGVPTQAPWFALPLTAWLAEDRAQPEAVAVCRPPECGPGLVATVVRLSGPDADLAHGLLADPSPLARSLEAPRQGKPVRTRVALQPLRHGAASGFAITLARRDGTRRPAYGAALGQRTGADLRLVLVIGEEADAVEETARRVAREHLGA